MGYYNGIYINRRVVHSIRNWAIGPIGLEYLFTDTPVRKLSGSDAIPFATYWRIATNKYPESEEEIYVVQVPARQLRDKLDAMGIGVNVIERELESYERERLRIAKHHLEYVFKFKDGFDPGMNGVPKIDPFPHEMITEIEAEVNSFEAVAFNEWWDNTREHIRSTGHEYNVSHNESYIWPFDEFTDIRVVLRTIVEHAADDDTITIDLTQDGGGSCLALDKDQVITQSTSLDLGLEPAIVLTEGVFDAKVLAYGLHYLKPHLTPYIKFFEHSLGVEGGVASVIKTLKSFTAAGICNRVVALLDNDSAAYEAAAGLKKFKLPEHFAILHYPDLDIARNYPTFGPQGTLTMNVNKLAGSIELYLGTDILKAADGTFSPVQWKSRMPGIGKYQGEVIDKSIIQKKFTKRLQELKEDPSVINSQDWSGVTAIIESLLNTLSSLPASGATQSQNLYI